MRLSTFIEKYFWLFLLSGMIVGVILPLRLDFLESLFKPFLMVMLFLVFLKTDVAHIFHEMKNYRFMLFIVIMNMAVIPVIFYLAVNLVDSTLAVGILLITAMPAGVTTPALTDIVKGNTALSASIVIATSLVTPLTVPLLFWVISSNNVAVDPWMLFKDLAAIIFLPMVISQLIKKYSPQFIKKKGHLFTSGNVIILFLMVYAVMGSQRDVILENTLTIFWQVIFFYLIFIFHHY